MSDRRPHTDKPIAEGAPDAEEDVAETARARLEQERSAEEAAASGGGPETDEPADARPSGPDDAAPAAPKPRRRRRGSGEVPAPRGGGSDPASAPVEVRASARYVRTAPRKARLVIDHIRGKDVDAARAILEATPRAAARDVLRLLDSAIANAENNHELVAGDLRIGRTFVDEGPTLKRYRPRALGRATRIRKRTSHMTIALTPKE
jgi:ribosomal protein L22